MCGIVAVLARPSQRPVPAPADVTSALARARAHMAVATTAEGSVDVMLKGLRAATEELKSLDGLLRGVPGLTCFLGHPAVVAAVSQGADELGAAVTGVEADLDAGSVTLRAGDLEDVNAALVGLRDAIWALGQDRLSSARSVDGLARALSGCLGPNGTPAGQDDASPRATTAVPPAPALGVLWAVNVAFRALDRLEVRGRDSAGVHLMLVGHGLDLAAPDIQALMGARANDPLFGSMAVRAAEGCLSLVYKAAAEIGELGDNVAALRRALAADPLLARALTSPDVEATVVAHTRWASVGLISAANAHPLNSEEAGGPGTLRPSGPYAVGVLNGDVDNYAELLVSERVSVPSEVTTDAKLVPTLVSRHLAAGATMADAFRQAMGRLEGSVGIAVNAAGAPGQIYLALRGSGQGLNIGLAEDAFVVASEAYGLVEEATTYLRMDGEGGGQLVCCDRQGAGDLAGLTVTGYDGAPTVVTAADLKVAEITTRDVDRRGYPHFLLKEIYESPLSLRKTLRGKVVADEEGRLRVALGEDVVPPAVARALRSGEVKSVIVIGQGTAAVAGQAVAAAIGLALPGVAVRATPASELSGWGLTGGGLPDDMSGALVVAISQSGTTTDTNRTVDLVRARAAHVIAIVNRRNSDLVQKAHGVLYTSDGRDVEMSVASTKAFYSQVAAGHLLALGLAGAADVRDGGRAQEVLQALRELPDLLGQVLEQRPHIARLASALAPSRRSWAVVGSGPDRVAAAEVRIKLSELCYKAIALDSIEDKKHIDLSAEPLIIVCAASVSGANAQDIAKETEIFRAHKAAPVVIIPETEKGRFHPGVDVVTVPACHPELGFVLAAMAGHIFGYEAALSIDAQARPLREARALLEAAPPVPSGPAALGPLALDLETAVVPALAGLRSGAYDGNLNASTAARLTSLLRYATGALPVEGYEAEMGRVGTPSAIAADLAAALSAAIDELTRPIDAIKHQAKTVTVGISRSEQALVQAALVVETLGAGAALESLGYRSLRTLSALGAVVEEVLGFTRYRIDGPVREGQGRGLEGATVEVIDQGGIARGFVSRTARDNTLRGTKHRAADKREVTVFRGLHDGRTGLMVPEVKDGQVTGITLLHARFADRLTAELAKAVLQSYQGRYVALVDAVTESRPHFDDAVLASVPMVELLTEPVAVLARHWVP
jgi:glutamine---fructose-6-phosphate transaminase (isomerizing)